MCEDKTVKGWYLEFRYDTRGFGMLRLHQDHLIPLEYAARTGSIDRQLYLVHSIPFGVWTITEPPVDTDEVAMTIEPGLGWKVRMLTPEGLWSRYLIHPDGNRPGTAGCIGIQGESALDLKQRIAEILNAQKEIPVYVNTPIPEDGIYAQA